MENGVGEGCRLFAGKPRTAQFQFSGAAINQEGADCHGGLELEGLPVGGIEGQGDGVVLDAGLSLGTETGAFGDELYEFAGYGNLAFGLFGEGYADGVANTFGEQCSDAEGTLDASVLALASLGNAEVQGVVHVLLIHRFH